MKYKYTTLVFFLLLSVSLMAQKKLNDATMHYSITVTGAKNALNGAKMKIFVKGQQSAAQMESSMGSESTIYDSKAGQGFILKSYSGQQLMITMTRANWQQKNKVHPTLKFTIEDTDEKFGNYKLKKATATVAGGRVYTVYFTPDLVLNNNEYNNAFPQLPGVPVRYSIVSGDIVFTYSLDKVETDPVDSKVFEAPKSGYRIMTFEENMQLRKEGIR